jgi:tetratricopeptide (TPR) repeat protein
MTSPALGWPLIEAVVSVSLDSVRANYQARRYADVVAAVAASSPDAWKSTPELGYMLADSARRVGGYDGDILALITDVADAARAAGNTSVLCSALNLQGVIQLERGQAQSAERVWCDLVIVATAADDPQFVARASNNLGVSAILDMRLETAITNFQRAISAYLRLGYARGCAQAHQNLGIVFREMDHVQESHNHFEQAITFANTADCDDDVARAEQETALLMIYAREDLARAGELARQALERFSLLRQPAGTAEAFRVMGVVALASSNRDEASHSFQTALTIAQARQLRLLEAETLTGMARVARLHGEAPASYQMQQQAEQIFLDIGAAPWGQQVRRRMEELG